MKDGMIGFLGLGAMGGPIAKRMADWAQRHPGKQILVYDPRPEAMRQVAEAGAQPAASVAEIAAQCPVVLACLPSATISENVALGSDGIGAVRGVRTYIEMSTIGSAAMQRIAEGLAEAFPATAIVTEEQSEGHGQVVSTFLIVDPLDGTKEFIQRRGDFTVNIAYVEDGK